MALAAKRTFGHGVHIPDSKALSEKKAIEIMPAPKTVGISLSQHIGKPATPLVKEGDVVKRGQLIGAADGFISANIYSSVSGTVKDIKAVINHTGLKQEYIFIENDFTDDEILLPPIDVNDGKAIIERVKEAGLVGLGGAGFPTAVKLRPQSEVDTVLVNAAECEPYLTCDHRILIEKTEELVKGARFLKKALEAATADFKDKKEVSIIFGIEDNKPDAIKALSQYEDVKVVPLKKKYPQGSEKQLIFASTGRKVAPGKLPASTGVCVFNVQTVKQAYDAVEKNKPLYERVMTVTGRGIKEPKNLLVKNGTSYTEIVDYCGGLNENARKIIAGGPMMGKVLPSLNGYTRKTDSGLLILAKGEANELEPTACINCGRCARVCPMQLMPMYIDLFTHNGNYERADEYGASNCFECGCCSYVCPAKRDLVGSIQLCKKKLRELKR